MFDVIAINWLKLWKIKNAVKLFSIFDYVYLSSFNVFYCIDVKNIHLQIKKNIKNTFLYFYRQTL